MSTFSTGAGTGGPRSLLAAHADGGQGRAIDPHVIRRLMTYLRPYRKHMVAAFFAMLAVTALTLAAPWLILLAIDDAIAAGDLPRLALISGLLVLTFLGTYVAHALQTYLLSWVGQRMLATMRSQLFRHLQRLSLRYHTEHPVGVTISRVINDVATINEVLSQGLVQIIGDSLVLIGIVVAMLVISTELALTTFAVVPVMVVATLIFSRLARRAFRATRTAVAAMVGNLAEAIGGMRVIRAFAQMPAAAARFERRNRDGRDAQVRAFSLSLAFTPVVEFLALLATAAVLLFGGLAHGDGAVSIGVMVAFLAYVSRFFQPIQDLSQLYASMQSAMAGGEKVLELLDTEPRIVDAPDAPPMRRIEGRIELRGVSFAYEPDQPVLQDIDLTIEAGQSVALIGETGAGKTTIANLISRFYDVTEGQVLIDGIDVRSVQQRTLRAQMALVSQDPFLFPGTIADNIRFGAPAASDDVVVDAAQAVGLHRFVERLPDGYDTQMLEFGTNISVGQRQLIAIARALIADPRLIVLDEATSSVDVITETVIQGGLRRLLQGRTAIIIAHRLSTVRAADCLFVIKDQGIVERGAHDELMSLDGVYADLYGRQMGREER